MGKKTSGNIYKMHRVRFDNVVTGFMIQKSDTKPVARARKKSATNKRWFEKFTKKDGRV